MTYSSFSQNLGGSTPEETPRYTFVASVSLPSLTMLELITWRVVMYRFDLHRCSRFSCIFAFFEAWPRSTALYLKRGTRAVRRGVWGVTQSRSTALYLMNMGPVYSRAPTNSSSESVASFFSDSWALRRRRSWSNASIGFACRGTRSGEVRWRRRG